ncbi:VacJ family lipoprotein [Sulfurimonas sp. MAG313]|nr:VacJ family lipoprotein [Sulfurimonas sp. MAG313]MDF1881972.1 VacJ family lipoprotein [Sulfurimonas sp. MAG313]
MRYLFFLLFLSLSLCARSNGIQISQELVQPKEVQITLEEADSSEDFFEEDESEDFDDEFDTDLEDFASKEIQEVFDPLNGYNRWMTGVNDSLMLNFVDHAAEGYAYVVPEVGRKSVNHFFNNLYYPVSLMNNILQLEIMDSGTETMRFLINSTIGLLGLFDPADAWFDIPMKKEDFGQTLGYYGVGSGFPIVLPFFGQRNLRDLTGTFVDGFVDPLYYVNGRFYNTVQPYWQSVIIIGYDDLNEYSLTPGAYRALTGDAIDLYPYLRNAYEQYRNQLIKE